ncbi:MAG: hypothetical protein ABIH11_07465 [Candidatus Altiarchaeota archaeon]
MKDDDKIGKQLWPVLLDDFVGEIGCVTEHVSEEKEGAIRILGDDFPARSKEKITRGRWARVVDHSNGILGITPLNVWLGSCCCR